jgi:LytS/YehU family sensor histidine kinase
MPGRYVFELQVTAHNGYVFDAKRSLAFTILQPYWKSWWFVMVLLILLASGIYAFVVHRIRFVKKQAQLRHALDTYRDKALRAQMNPHFIYNSMNAIQNYITKNNTGASIDFLSRFSRLMRLTFQNSFTELVLLEKDLEALVLYTEMENMRFPGKFQFELCCAENLRSNALQVPPLLVQPFVENAILHAFPNRKDTGCIRLQICQQQNRLYFAIRDNGIGRNEALLYQKRKQKYRHSEERKESGITITAERIRQAWSEGFNDELFKITDLFDAHKKAVGTLVEFYLPLHYDQTSLS